MSTLRLRIKLWHLRRYRRQVQRRLYRTGALPRTVREDSEHRMDDDGPWGWTE